MTQFGFYYDAENCIGCHTCQVACKDTHRLSVGENYRHVSTYCTGSGYTPRLYHVSMACNHCTKPTCMDACSQGAFKRTNEGLVLIEVNSCNGCGDCLDACPYEAITLTSSGIAGKCDGCILLRSQGELPACVASCPQRVLEFGDIDVLRQTHSGEQLVSDVASLPNSYPTQPNLVMRVKDCMTDRDFDQLVI
jgi:anaerobic dimethyl sulfoxide reductase subunit B